MQFQRSFQRCPEAVRTTVPAEVITLDGKTARGLHEIIALPRFLEQPALPDPDVRGGVHRPASGQ